MLDKIQPKKNIVRFLCNRAHKTKTVKAEGWKDCITASVLHAARTCRARVWSLTVDFGGRISILEDTLSNLGRAHKPYFLSCKITVAFL